jgi:hypothetical protein
LFFFTEQKHTLFFGKIDIDRRTLKIFFWKKNGKKNFLKINTRVKTKTKFLFVKRNIFFKIIKFIFLNFTKSSIQFHKNGVLASVEGRVLGRDLEHAREHLLVLLDRVADVVGDVLADEDQRDVGAPDHRLERGLDLAELRRLGDDEVVGRARLAHVRVARAGEDEAGDRVLVADDADKARLAGAELCFGRHIK